MRLIYASEIKRKADCYPKQIRDVVANILRHTKSVDAVPVRHGEWINVEHAFNDMWFCTCSVCGEIQTVEIAKLIHFNYCPHCGADMGGKEVGKR